MKSFLKVLTTSTIILTLSTTPLISNSMIHNSSIIHAAGSQLTGNDRFQFTKSSSIYYINGEKHLSDEKMLIVNGTMFVQFKAIAAAYNYKISYNSETKESIAQNKHTIIKFKAGEDTITVNGKTMKAGGKVHTKNGHLMIPIRAWSNATGSKLQVSGQYISLQLNTLPSAKFKINETKIIAGETSITTTDLASSPSGNAIIAEQWEGLESIYDEPGNYTVTRRVQDDQGYWSNPYSVTITVKAQNIPPVANFVTDKTTYKIGEKVVYTNLSSDSDGKIIGNTWKGNAPAFFEAGTHTISLTVQDDQKATHTIEKQITVTDEVLYTQQQFYLNFANTGEKFPIESKYSLSMPSIKYDIVSHPITTVRTNSPEQITSPAVDYTDVISGPVRFNIHKQNMADETLELHLIATNESEEEVDLSKIREVHAGPTTYVSTAGKTASSRYLQSINEPDAPINITLQPGESVELFNSTNTISPRNTLSIFSEYETSTPVRYTLVVTKKGADAITEMANLPQSEHDGKHIRATFKDGNRDIVINKVLGETSEKIILGDKTQEYDTLLTGTDAITGNEVINYGNGGVVYNLSLQVAPRTAVLLNPRGGHYGGAFLINNKVYSMTDTSILSGPTEAGFIYRTGDSQETVNIQYIVAPGSNMPLHMMFIPMPSLTN